MKKYLSIFVAVAFVVGLMSPVAPAKAYDFPSTNADNKAGTNPVRSGIGPHVNFVEATEDSVTLEFIMPYSYAACFEYRSDGESSQYGDIYPHPVVIGDYWYYYFCMTSASSPFEKTFQANEYVEIRLAVGAERDWDFDWTRFDVLFNRTAEITSPAEGAEVYGDVSFDAVLNDKDGNDNVQWAVRKGTCTAGTGTVAGNVDGKSDDYDWDHYNFHSLLNVDGWDLGGYCFVFNPTESAGDVPIRLTREFTVIDPDSDDDGVLIGDDLCPNTVYDTLDVELGVNRHAWLEGYGNSFTTLVPGKKGAKVIALSEFNLDYTYGCSCEQILNSMSDILAMDFEGHYKYGCSKSIIEDWNAGKYYVGPTLVETVEVPADDTDGVTSLSTLETGKDYFLKAYSTADAGDGIEFDAKYSFRTLSSTEWTDAVSTYESYGTELLDLFVDNTNVDWGTYNSEHVYQIPYAGTGNQTTFKVNDIYYPNNVGSLFVDIFEDKWVDLW